MKRRLDLEQAGVTARENLGLSGQLSLPACMHHLGFLGGSDVKESACNARDLGSIPGWEDPLEEGMAIHSGILAWRIPMDRGARQSTVYGITKSWTRLSDSAHTCIILRHT